SRGRDGLGGVVAGHYRRRPDYRAEVDPPFAPQPEQGVAPTGGRAGGEQDRPPAAAAGFLLADQPQAAGGDARPSAGPAVPLPDPTAPAVPVPGMAGDQRRYQEEGM